MNILISANPICKYIIGVKPSIKSLYIGMRIPVPRLWFRLLLI